jgi:diketogulonate reductase-like aldo/keto reductase
MVRFASLLFTGLGLTLAAAFSPEPTIEISDGVYMPYVSLGHPDDGNVTEKQSLELWLKLGGVGVDTAYDYMNQNQVGAAIAASGRARNSIFVTTKIPNPVGRAKALAYVKEDLKEMNLDFADLILIHSPCTEGFPGSSSCTGRDADRILDTWKGLEDALAMNLTRAIGVSNFVEEDLRAILDAKPKPSTIPAVNQCSMSIGNHDDATRAFCASHGITYEAYSPLSHVDFSDSRLSKIAAAHGVSAAQVALRWITQTGSPLATSPDIKSYDLEDLAIFNFQLSNDEMEVLSSI